jgi:cyclopropane fatty-acyl-phospholipid synthase-like methyltransferase
VSHFLDVLEPGSRILDVGTGNALIARYQAEHGHNVLGIDLQLLPFGDSGAGIGEIELPLPPYRAVSVPGIKGGSLTVMATDVFEFIPESVFDGISALAFLHYVGNRSELRVLFDTFCQWLQPSGYLAASWICGEDEITRDVDAFFPTTAEVMSVATKAGFGVVESWKASITHAHGNILESPEIDAVEHSHSFNFTLWQKNDKRL